MDIRKEVFSDTAIINDFLYPDGSKIIDDDTGEPVFIEVYGAHTDAFRHAQDLFAWQAKNAKDEKTDKAPTIAEARAEKEKEIKILTPLLTRWGGFKEEGAPLELTPENIMKVFIAAPYVKDRVNQSILKKLPYFKRLNPE